MILQDSARNVRSHCQIASFVYQQYNAHSAQLDITFTISPAFPVKRVSTLPIFTSILCFKHALDALLLATLASIRLIVLPVLLVICSTAIVWHTAHRITIIWEVHASHANFLACPAAATFFAFPATLRVSSTCLWSPTPLAFFTHNVLQEATFPQY